MCCSNQVGPKNWKLQIISDLPIPGYICQKTNSRRSRVKTEFLGNEISEGLKVIIFYFKGLSNSSSFFREKPKVTCVKKGGMVPPAIHVWSSSVNEYWTISAAEPKDPQDKQIGDSLADSISENDELLFLLLEKAGAKPRQKAINFLFNHLKGSLRVYLCFSRVRDFRLRNKVKNFIILRDASRSVVIQTFNHNRFIHHKHHTNRYWMNFGE